MYLLLYCFEAFSSNFCIIICMIRHLLGVEAVSISFKFFKLCYMCTFMLDRVEDADVNTQTDAFLDRPPTPLFVPAKTGTDVSTQIEDGDVGLNKCFSL